MFTACKLCPQCISNTLMTLVIHPKKGKTHWCLVLHCLFNSNLEGFLTEHRVLWEQWGSGSFWNLERLSWGGEWKTGCLGGRKTMTSERKSQVWLEDQKKTLTELTEQTEERSVRLARQVDGSQFMKEEPCLHDLPSPIPGAPSLHT